MAKAKKQEKTIEQRLEEALVLYEKTPYKLPSNWCWVKFTAIIDIKGGNQPPKSQFSEEPREGYIRFIQIRDYTSDKFKTYIPIKDNLTLVDKEDILIARYGASLGKICRGIDGACNVALAKTIFDKKNILPDYLFYLLKTEVFQTPLSLLSRTAQAGFNKNDLDNFKFPLAPLGEQKQIVEIIEKQFAKLDEARDLIQKSLDSFVDRKSAILHKAFTGELTKKWREINSISPKWEESTLCKVVDVRDGTHDSPKFFDVGYPLVTSKNLKNGKITEDNIKYICQEDYEKINERSKVDIYDILFAMIGTIGNPVVVEIEPKFAIKNVALLKYTGKINPYFVKYYLESKSVIDKMKDEARGSTQKFVSLGYLRSFPIKVPSFPEQEEIVRILDSIFEKEDKSKELIDMLDKIDEMKKSILARAFRGELGTNNPNDEPAIDLLRKILAQSN